MSNDSTIFHPAPAPTVIDWAKVTKTTGGSPVRIYAVGCGGEYPIHGAIQMSEGRETWWESYSWIKTGKYDSCRECGLDLDVPAAISGGSL